MPLPGIADLVVDALAAHRLVRLIQRDTITARARTGLIDRLPDDHPLVELLVCHWCAHVHAAALTQLARAAAPRWWPRIAGALAVATTASLVADIEDR